MDRDILLACRDASLGYEHRALLEHLHDLGGRIILTTDCHRAEWVDCGLAQAAQLARECGFRESWIWKDGGFQAVEL